MRQRSNCPSLAIEPLAKGGVRDGTRRQDLDGDLPMQTRVARPIHLAHAATANRLDDLVRFQMGSRPHHIVGGSGRLSVQLGYLSIPPNHRDVATCQVLSLFLYSLPPRPVTGVVSVDPFFAKIIASNCAGSVWLGLPDSSCTEPGGSKNISPTL
jgi:hypothetical protein